MTRRCMMVSLALLPAVVTVGSAQEAAKPVSLKDLPRPPSEKYRVDPYIAAAAALQADSKAAGDALRKLAKDADADDDSDKVIVLCRMLFTAKPKGKFRRPLIGQPVFLGSGDMKDWPLEPIEVVDGIPFVVVTGYSLGGQAESASQYLSYCQDECDWPAEKYKPKNKEAKEKALAKLLADKRWKEPLTKDEKEFLSSQLK